MIEVHGLTKIFSDRKRGDVRAVDQLSFQVRPGQIYGLLGANGAGKTTTLRLLATLLKPSAGAAVVAGFEVGASPEKVRASLGFLATSTALYGRLTARETIRYFGGLHGLKPALVNERLEQLADQLEMREFLDRRVEKFSTGMKQKVSIARTLIHNPPVMIFDEPTNGLDVMAARSVLRFIQECRVQGKTVIYSSHIMTEVEKLCDVVGIVHGGRLLAEGSPVDLKTRYQAADLEDVFVRVVDATAVL